MRKEHDCVGEMELDDALYYGIQTERARRNFPVSGQTYESYPLYLKAIALIKKAAASANKKIGALPADKADAICKAADEIISGKMKGMFPIDVFSGGTSVNMNVNEVIANRANELLTGHKGYDAIHPNTHVNMGQSTNDVIPSAISLSSYMYFDELIPVLQKLSQTLLEKSIEFASVVKIGRTCLQDAVPITLGQEFSGYHSLIERQISLCRTTQKACAQLPLGGTAIGTCLGTFPGYLPEVYRSLAAISHIPVTPKENIIDGYQNDDGVLMISAAIKSTAASLSKISRDFRLMSSGPRAGLNEIHLPSLQPGSSIMPGKINPVIPEMMIHLCYQIYGNDLAIAMSVEAGELDLNVWDAPMRKCLQESFLLLIRSIPIFTERCAAGITANESTCRQYAENSLSNATVISAIYGYEIGTSVVKEAYTNQESIKAVAIRRKLFSAAEAEEMLNPLLLTQPEECSKKINAFKQTMQQR